MEISKDELTRIQNDPEGVHQGLMNVAYDRWYAANEVQGKHVPMADWFGSLSEIERAAVALGKLNQQVCNGGFNQWFENGYGPVMAETCLQALAAMPPTSTVEAVTALLNLYQRIVEDAEDGECTGCGACKITSADERAFEALADDDLNDRYYAIDTKFLAECEVFYSNRVQRLRDGEEVVVLAHPLSVYPPGKPTVRLVGMDGNAFAILGACKEAARKAGWSDDQIRLVQEEMMNGDYNLLMATACKYFEVS